MKKIFLLLALFISFKAFSQTVPTTPPPVSPVQLNTTTWYWEPSTKKHFAYNGSTYLWWQPADSIQVLRMIARAVVGGTTASNGLTKVGNDIQLGGVLTNDVLIDANGHVLTLGVLSITEPTATINIDQAASAIDLNTLNGDNTATSISLQPQYLAITSAITGTSGVNGAGIVWDNTNGMSPYDDANLTGFVYKENYNTNQLANDRAITDVGGVKQLITTGGGNYVNLTGTQTITGNKTFSGPLQITSTGNDTGTGPGSTFTFQGVANFNASSGFNGDVTLGDAENHPLIFRNGTADWKIQSQGPDLKIFPYGGSGSFKFTQSLTGGDIYDSNGTRFLKAGDATIDTTGLARKTGNSAITNLRYITNGTAGNGYVDLISQSASPSSSTGHLRLYSDSLNRLSWKNSTYRRTIRVNRTSDQTITMPFRFNPIVADSTDVALNYFNKSDTATTASIQQPFTLMGWGDSLTAGTANQTPWPTAMYQLTGITTYNGGIGGQTSTQISSRELPAAEKQGSPTVIWAGRNNYTDSVTVKSDIAAMVASLTTPNYIVVSLLNSNTETVGTSGYNQIIALNNYLSTTYGSHYLDVRSYLVGRYNPSIPQDVTDHANDVIPSSLRVDFLHLTSQGYIYVAQRIITKFSTLGLTAPVNNKVITPLTLAQSRGQANGVYDVFPTGSYKVGGTTIATIPDQTYYQGSIYYGDGGNRQIHTTGLDGQQNTFVGIGAGLASTTSNSNTALGNTALSLNLTGNNNVAVGYTALQKNKSGTANVALGYGALQNDTTSNNNTALGHTALNLSTAANNVAVGYASSRQNTTGTNNASFGYSSALSNTTGGSNTSIGTNANFFNTTGSFNTMVGRNSGQGATGASNVSNNTFLGYNSGTAILTGGNSNTLIGYQSGVGITTGLQNTFLGFNSGGGVTTGNYNTVIGGSVGSLATTLANTVIIADGQGNQIINVNASTGRGQNLVMATPNGSSGIGTYRAIVSADIPTNLALSGIPTASTATALTNTTQLATTAFVTTADNLKLNITDTAAQNANLVHKALNETITGVKTFSKSVATTPADIIMVSNPTAATVGQQQYSPGINLQGNGWGTTLGTSQPANIRIYNSAFSSTTGRGSLAIDFSNNGAAYGNRFMLSDAGGLTLNGGSGSIAAGAYTGSVSGFAVTPTLGQIFQNNSASTVGVPVQYSPYSAWKGTVWNTTPTAASNTVEFRADVRGVSGTTPSFNWTLSSINNGGASTPVFSIDNTGLDNYQSDLSSTYTIRTKVDKGYVDGKFSKAVVRSAAGTLTLAYGTDYVFTGTTSTYTLPAVSASNATRSDFITVKNAGSGNITLNSNSGSTIYDGSLVSTITISPGASVTLINDSVQFNKE